MYSLETNGPIFVECLLRINTSETSEDLELTYQFLIYSYPRLTATEYNRVMTYFHQRRYRLGILMDEFMFWIHRVPTSEKLSEMFGGET